MLSHSIVWHLLHVVYNILNMQRYAFQQLVRHVATVLRRRREAANISAPMKTFHCYDIVRHFHRTHTASLAWPTSRVGENGKLLWKCVDYRRILWHEISTKKPKQICKVNKSHSKPNCFENVWKHKDRLWIWTNNGD